jgi:hypothetical protein
MGQNKCVVNMQKCSQSRRSYSHPAPIQYPASGSGSPVSLAERFLRREGKFQARILRYKIHRMISVCLRLDWSWNVSHLHGLLKTALACKWSNLGVQILQSRFLPRRRLAVLPAETTGKRSQSSLVMVPSFLDGGAQGHYRRNLEDGQTGSETPDSGNGRTF